MAQVLWTDRKRWLIGVPWTFTTYTLYDNKFTVETGLLNKKEYDVRLYRITNISLSRSLFQRMFGVGTIHIDANDKDLGCFDLKNVREPKKLQELFSEQVEEERIRNNVTAREYMMDSGGGFHDEYH